MPRSGENEHPHQCANRFREKFDGYLPFAIVTDTVCYTARNFVLAVHV